MYSKFQPFGNFFPTVKKRGWQLFPSLVRGGGGGFLKIHLKKKGEWEFLLEEGGGGGGGTFKIKFRTESWHVCLHY